MTRKDSHAKTVCITGTGSYLPEKVLTNFDLEKMVETTDEWIRTRTGIRERHIAQNGEGTCLMAAQSALRALRSADMSPEEVEIIIVGTFTPDMLLPNTACLVQDRIGAENALCFDLSAACSGFVYGLEVARGLILGSGYRNALVIGVEKLSAVTDWRDRNTCVLFGDGGGAAVLEATDKSGRRGLLASAMGADGSLADLLNIPGGGSRMGLTRHAIDDRQIYIKMAGNEVFKHAVRCMCNAGQKALERSGLTMDDVNWVIPHQANARIVEAVASRLGNSPHKFCVNLERVGNISAASVPVALDEFVRRGKIKRGDTVLLVAFGGGFTWGAMVLEWGY
ncbi:MAG: beta-ketoacyl-ACP synthase III [Verrucomicrobiota bacterium]|nr:beta-ketoacyl-ACP synthase III [Verrucomicrobiota bacterium]